MAVRLLLTDETWSEFESILLEVKRKVGRPPDLSDRMFVEAVLYIARTGTPWRDLPDEFGNWSAVYNRNAGGKPTESGNNSGNDSGPMRWCWLKTCL